jgi:hypothetical protein
MLLSEFVSTHATEWMVGSLVIAVDLEFHHVDHR